MNEPGLQGVLEAAVHDYISARCRPAYLHETRSGLQAIQSSVELMARSAAAAADNSAVARKASELAKRAIANHEIAISRVLDDLIATQQEAAPMDLGVLLGDVVEFLQNMLASNDLAVNLTAGEGIMIHARKGRLRMAVLGLIGNAVEAMPRGSRLPVSGERQSSRALLRLGWAGIDSALRIPDWNELRSGVDLNALIAPVARHVVMADGGQLTTSSGTGDEAALSITYPLLS